MFTVVVFFLVLSLLVIIHELGHFIMAKKNNVMVEEFGFGLPPRIGGIKFGETLYSLNWLPFGGFVKVLGEEEAELKGKKLSSEMKKRTFAYKKPWQKVLILTAGVLFNFILGWIIISYLFTRGVPVLTDNIIIEEVIENTPAAIQGIEKGDIITKITRNGEDFFISKVSDVSDITKKFAGEKIVLSILREDVTKEVFITPRKNPPEGEGSLGILITNYQIKKYSIIEAPFLGLVESAKITGIIFRELSLTLVRFVTFQKSDAEIAGPVGIARLTGDAARQGVDTLLQLIGLLSLNLAVINILPFPALDGGRLTLVIYEWVTKRKVNPTIERRLNLAGFVFLISLILLVTINDIIKLIHN